MLMHVAQYLCRTHSWGLIYCLPPTDPSLPRSSAQLIAGPLGLPDFPIPDKPGKLLGFVDAAHANNLCCCCSMTGYAFLLIFGVISYCS